MTILDKKNETATFTDPYNYLGVISVLGTNIPNRYRAQSPSESGGPT